MKVRSIHKFLKVELERVNESVMFSKERKETEKKQVCLLDTCYIQTESKLAHDFCLWGFQLIVFHLYKRVEINEIYVYLAIYLFEAKSLICKININIMSQNMNATFDSPCILQGGK